MILTELLLFHSNQGIYVPSLICSMWIASLTSLTVAVHMLGAGRVRSELKIGMTAGSS